MSGASLGFRPALAANADAGRSRSRAMASAAAWQKESRGFREDGLLESKSNALIQLGAVVRLLSQDLSATAFADMAQLADTTDDLERRLPYFAPHDVASGGVFYGASVPQQQLGPVFADRACVTIDGPG